VVRRNRSSFREARCSSVSRIFDSRVWSTNDINENESCHHPVSKWQPAETCQTSQEPKRVEHLLFLDCLFPGMTLSNPPWWLHKIWILWYFSFLDLHRLCSQSWNKNKTEQKHSTNKKATEKHGRNKPRRTNAKFKDKLNPKRNASIQIYRIPHFSHQPSALLYTLPSSRNNTEQQRNVWSTRCRPYPFDRRHVWRHVLSRLPPSVVDQKSKTRAEHLLP